MHKGFIDGRIGILYLAGINKNILLILIIYNLSLLGKTDSGTPKQRKFKQLWNKKNKLDICFFCFKKIIPEYKVIH